MSASILNASTLLARLQLFRNVEIESVAGSIARCNFRQLPAGEIILTPAHENNSLFLVVSGRLLVYLDYPDHPPLTVVEPGECAGEMSIIEGKNPSAYVVTAEPTQVMEIPQDVMWELLHCSHQITRNMLHIMSLRVRLSNMMITDSINTQKECMRHATLDGLTGLHNRRWMDGMFEQEMLHSQRESRPLCVLMIDVDHFKKYNDEHGHPAGDAVLRSVANTLRMNLRPNDLLARYGGEEFAVMLTETNEKEAVRLAEKLRGSVSKLVIQDDENNILPSVTISIGVCRLQQQESLNALIRDADTGLYAAKHSGRNRVVLHE